jgi:hypothetical protein
MPPLSFAQALKARAGTSSLPAYQDQTKEDLEAAIAKEVLEFNGVSLLHHLNAVFVEPVPNHVPGASRIFVTLEGPRKPYD